MPLLDHFNPPLSLRRHWQGFHSAWASALARELNGRQLPPRYFAEPNVQLGGQMEVDVATFEERGNAGGAAVATAVWTAPRPALTAVVDFAGLEVFEVQVYHDEGGARLVAAIELISPANKDRPGHREAFVTKCAAYLQSGVSVVIVDVVTSRSANLHGALLARLGVETDAAAVAASNLYAAAYRTAPRAGTLTLEAWPEALALGNQLPSLPLWLDAGSAVPLHLEQSYAETCASLRITA